MYPLLKSQIQNDLTFTFAFDGNTKLKIMALLNPGMNLDLET